MQVISTKNMTEKVHLFKIDLKAKILKIKDIFQKYVDMFIEIPKKQELRKQVIINGVAIMNIFRKKELQIKKY